MATVELYWAALSPPARVAAIALNAGKATVNFHNVDLLKGEQKAPSYLEVSAKGQVPALVDGDLKLIESHAIARYAAAKYQDEANPIYPTEVVARAKIDEAIEIVRSDVGEHAGSLVFQKAFAKLLNRPTSEEAVTKATDGLTKGFTFIESYFFKTSPNHAVGSTLTLADLVFSVWLHQLTIVKYDLTPYPKIAAYFEHIKTVPAVAKTHEPFYAILAAFAAQQASN